MGYAVNVANTDYRYCKHHASCCVGRGYIGVYRMHQGWLLAIQNGARCGRIHCANLAQGELWPGLNRQISRTTCAPRLRPRRCAFTWGAVDDNCCVLWYAVCGLQFISSCWVNGRFRIKTNGVWSWPNKKSCMRPITRMLPTTRFTLHVR
jgi:hypothetical protein